MRYLRADLIKEIDDGLTDELGNPIYSSLSIPVECRTTEWTSEDVNVYGRDMTVGNRKVIFKPIRESLDGVTAIEVGGNQYQITSIKDLGRWIMLIVKGFRI